MSDYSGPVLRNPERLTPEQMLDISGLSAEYAVSRVIGEAVRLKASDLFFFANEDFYSIQIKHLGMLRPLSIVSRDAGRQFTQHIKAQAGMDVAERRKPQDGRWIYHDELRDAQIPTVVDLRINTLPTLYGEDFTLRLLSRTSGLFGIDQLGMSRPQLAAFEQMIASPSGLILITGPTGSGKTATLYAAMRQLHDGTCKINTIEDPIEFAIEGIRQSQVDYTRGLSFGMFLRSVLRQSPDVIMIGEIRDADTAETAVIAASSGHLVLATLHAPVAAAAIQSIRSLGVHPHFLATSLRGVISQRLIRTLDPVHRIAFDMDEASGTFQDVKHLLGPGEGEKLYAPRPMAENNFTGYLGQTGVFEVMDISRGIRSLIAGGAPTSAIRQKAVEEGMLEFRQSALLKVAQGVTSIEEIFRVIPSEHLLVDD